MDDIYPESYGENVIPGVTDMSGPIREAILCAGGKQRVVLQPSQTYLVCSEVSLHTGTEGPKIEGNFATIKAGLGMENVVSVGNTTTIRTNIRNLLIDANSLAGHGLKGILITEQNSLLQNIAACNALSDGMYFDGCQVARFENLKSFQNVGNGFLFESCNGLTADTVRAISNGVNGFVIQRGGRAYSGGMKLLNADAEYNAENGILVIDTVSPVLIAGGWVEANIKDGVLVKSTARGVSIKDNSITGGDAGNIYRAVRLEYGSAGCVATDNKLQYSQGTGGFAKVEDETRSFNNITYPNFYRSTGSILAASGIPIRSQSYVIGGVKQIANVPSGLFSVTLTDGQAVSMQLSVSGLRPGLTKFCTYQTIVIVNNGGTLLDASGQQVIAENGPSGACFSVSALGTTATINFNHGGSLSSNSWNAILSGKFTENKIVIDQQ